MSGQPPRWRRAPIWATGPTSLMALNRTFESPVLIQVQLLADHLQKKLYLEMLKRCLTIVRHDRKRIETYETKIRYPQNNNRHLPHGRCACLRSCAGVF